MAFRNDHEAALRRAAALEADLKAERVTEAEKDARIATLEHDLDAAQAALARAGITPPASVTSTASWADVSKQLDHYLAQRALASSRSSMRVGSLFVTLFSAMILIPIVAGIWPHEDVMLRFAIGPAVLIGVAIFIAAGFIFRPAKTYPPLACPTCKLEIVGDATSNEIKLVKNLHRCPHCQSALAAD